MTSERFEIHVGDCLEKLKTMADNSVDSVVCDPPYGLSKEPDMAEVLKHWLAGDDYTHKSAGFMGNNWDSFCPGPSVWKECLRVLKPGGHLLAFAGTRTQDLMALSIRLAGFQIRDSIDYMHSGEDDAAGFVDSLSPAQRDAFYRLHDQGDARWSWGYGSGFPKSMDVSKAIDKNAGADREVIGVRQDFAAKAGFSVRPNTANAKGYVNPQTLGQITEPATDAARQWQGWGSALKPAHEPIVVARKPLEGTLAANVLAHGTGALNIDGCRIDAEPRKISNYESTGTQGCMTHTGVAGHTGRAYSDRIETAGRFPANLLHDGSNEVVELFPDTGTSSGGGRKNCDKFGGGYAAPGCDAIGFGDSGSAARFFYCAKASSSDRHEGLEHPGHQFSEGSTLRDAENLGDGRKGNTHPTIKPTSLMQYLCRLVTPPNGTVLDPFMGSGSTGKAAIREGFNFIGCEIDQSYADIAYARISYELAKQLEETQQQDMFA